MGHAPHLIPHAASHIAHTAAFATPDDDQIFGLELGEFSRPALSALTLFHMLFGIVDIFYDLLAVDMWVGLFFFFAYIFLFFLMLVNIFLAILNDAYAVTKEGVEKQIEEKREEKARLVAGGAPPRRRRARRADEGRRRRAASSASGSGSRASRRCPDACESAGAS